MLEAASTPKKLSCIFSEDSVEDNEFSNSNTYHTDWRHSKSIQKSILSCGKSNEDCSCALTIALKQNLLKYIVAQAGDIVLKDFATSIYYQKQQTKIIAVKK